MEFTMKRLGADRNRGVAVEKGDGAWLVLRAGILESSPTYAPLNRSQALVLSDILRAMALGLEPEQNEG